MPIHIDRLQEVMRGAESVLMLLIACGSPACFASTWVYEASASGRAAVEISESLARVAIGDRGYQASFCTGPKLSCFRSEVLSFAVPTSVAAVKTWRDGPRRYELVGSRRLDFRGKQVRVIMIRQSPAALTESAPVFWYSRAYGLLAIADANTHDAQLLLLSGRCGFPKTRCGR